MNELSNVFFFDALFGDELLKKVALAHKRHFFSFYQARYEVLLDKLSAKMKHAFNEKSLGYCIINSKEPVCSVMIFCAKMCDLLYCLLNNE